MALSPAKIFGRPTADRIWLGPAQRRALAFLEEPTPGIVKILLGPHSCGKSIVLDRYLADLDDRIYFRSRDGWHSPTELLIALLESADIEPVTGSDDDRREQFGEYLREERALGNDLMFVIDGAEKLTSAVWLEFHRLSTLLQEDGYEPGLLIAGQPQAYEYLRSPMARDWNLRQFSVHRLPPLESLDVCVYIKDRLNSVGLPEAVFSAPARVLMGKLAGGSFTTTNLLCQMSLVLARQQNATFVDEELVQIAYGELDKGQAQAKAREIAVGSDTSEEGELFLSRGGKLVARHPLEARQLIGRGDHNQISLQSPDISRHHAVLHREGADYYIEDLGSVNGLTVNGELTTRRKLDDHDVITIGPFQVTYVAPVPEERRGERRPPLQAIEEISLDSWESAPEPA